MREVTLKSLEEYMLNNIDIDNLIEVDKVKRYVNLTSQFRKLRRSANKSEPVIETINGQQSYKKINPAIEKMATINSQLNALYRIIEFKMPEPEQEDEEVITVNDNLLDDSELV